MIKISTIFKVGLVLAGALTYHVALAMQAGIESETLQQDKELFALKRNLIKCFDASSLKKKDNAQQVASASLRALDRSSSDLDDEGMVEVMKELKESGFEALNLSHNKLENVGVQMLFDDLPLSVKVINLSHNKLTSSLGIGGVMKRLKKAVGLESLDLSHNLARDELIVGRAIEKALKKNSPLKTLKLRGMGLNDESVDFIARGLSHNKNLIYLDISENPINGISPIPSLLHENASLKHVEVDNCGMDREDFIDILFALNKNQTLEYFAFDKNPGISDEELELWSPKIKQDLGFKVNLKNHTLTRIFPLNEPVPREYWVYFTKKDKPSTAEKM